MGIKAIEYAQWLHAGVLGTAGQCNKHRVARNYGAEHMCSSRSGDVFALGATMLAEGSRSHMVFNSLSNDFISVSFSLLGEGGCLSEIGKRAIWSLGRHEATAPHALYTAIAVDSASVFEPEYVGYTMKLLSGRAEACILHSLPLRSFDLETQFEAASACCRAAQHRKCVMRITEHVAATSGSHVVTGGTSGLGLLTARWLSQRGARAGAGRAAARLPGHRGEWSRVVKSSVPTTLEKCDTAEVGLVRRLLAVAEPEHAGVWHAAGVLADALLPNQKAPALAKVYAPKALGAWALHAGSAMAPLDANVLFSSIASLFGLAGQANYSAANQTLDALSCYRRVHGQASVSVQWAGWLEVAAPAEQRAQGLAMEKATGMGRTACAGARRAAHGGAAWRCADHGASAGVLGRHLGRRRCRRS